MEPEWGFPKGRRNYNENDLICAIREVHEETGLEPSMYHLHQQVIPFKEEISAINQVSYCQKYYLARLNPGCQVLMYNPTNQQQIREVRKVGWFTIKQIATMNITKNKVMLLHRIHNLVKRIKSQNNI